MILVGNSKRRIVLFPAVIVKTVFVCGMEKRSKSYRRSLKGRMINMLVVIEFLNPRTSCSPCGRIKPGKPLLTNVCHDWLNGARRLLSGPLGNRELSPLLSRNCVSFDFHHKSVKVVQDHASPTCLLPPVPSLQAHSLRMAE